MQQCINHVICIYTKKIRFFPYIQEYTKDGFMLFSDDTYTGVHQKHYCMFIRPFVCYRLDSKIVLSTFLQEFLPFNASKSVHFIQSSMKIKYLFLILCMVFNNNVTIVIFFNCYIILYFFDKVQISIHCKKIILIELEPFNRK